MTFGWNLNDWEFAGQKKASWGEGGAEQRHRLEKDREVVCLEVECMVGTDEA